MHHVLNLPQNFDITKKWPVMIELPGNKWSASHCSGMVEDCKMASYLTDGRLITAAMPFCGKDGENSLFWWHDEHKTAEYIYENTIKICEQYNGDKDNIFLCGFSRGAIGVNYFGLYNDEIASLWRGFITHDHYDGVRQWIDTPWGCDKRIYRENAVKRLKRLNKRPCLIMQNPDTKDIKDFIFSSGVKGDFTFLDVKMNEIYPVIPCERISHSHNYVWLNERNKYADTVKLWLESKIKR